MDNKIILVTGTLGYDYIMDFPGVFADRIMPDKIHKISLSFLVDKLSKNFGGTAANIAYTLKLMGLEPLIASPAGDDFAPFAGFLKKHKIQTTGIVLHKDVATGAYFVVTDKEDNQIGSFYLGATKFAKDIDISRYKTKKPFVIVAPTDPSAMMRYVADALTLGLPYLFDPAFQIGSLTEEQLRTGIEHAAIFIGNDYEIALAEQKLGITHEDLRVMVPIVITTLGSKGSIVETRFESMHIKPAKIKKLADPTGAGDAYRGGFIAGYVQKLPLDVCGQMASVAAAYAIEHYGTINHMYTSQDFKKRYTENYQTKIPS